MGAFWLVVGLAIGGLLGYLVGAFCASAGNEDMQRSNGQLYWTLVGLIAAAEHLHDDLRLAEMLKVARDVVKKESNR